MNETVLLLLFLLLGTLVLVFLILYDSTKIDQLEQENDRLRKQLKKLEARNRETEKDKDELEDQAIEKVMHKLAERLDIKAGWRIYKEAVREAINDAGFVLLSTHEHVPDE